VALKILPPPRVIRHKGFTGDVPLPSAGGSKLFPLQPGISGDALFSSDGLYRHWLSRTRTSGTGYLLWVGHNPSTAEGMKDDPTIRREMEFTWREGFRSMFKVNLMDLRATNPKDLLDTDLFVSSGVNYIHIRRLAKDAEAIVMAYGVVNKAHHTKMNRVSDELHKFLDKQICLGLTQSGYPRHPLYVDGTTPFLKFAGLTPWR
jgi:hypothetical protein